MGEGGHQKKPEGLTRGYSRGLPEGGHQGAEGSHQGGTQLFTPTKKVEISFSLPQSWREKERFKVGDEISKKKFPPTPSVVFNVVFFAMFFLHTF